jgi:predicted nicotinamide N-methyase
MPGYEVKHERIAIAGADALQVRSLLDRQQFTDPHGDALRMGISSAAWPLFGLVWPSGLRLAARLALRPVTSERILEIGCGLALASLVGHRRGADITASDCHPQAANFLLENVRLNALLPLPYRHGHWTADEPPPLQGPSSQVCVLSGRFELIIGSDLLYERDDGATLPAFIDRHAAPDAEVWIVDPDRGNRAAFNRQMAVLGFAMREERMDLAATAQTAAYKGRMLIYRRSDS